MTTTYETVRRTTVTRKSGAKPDTKPAPVKGTLDIYRGDNGMILIDACVPVEIAARMLAAYDSH